MNSDDESFALSRRQMVIGSAALVAVAGCRSAGGRPTVAVPNQKRGNVIDMDTLVADCIAANKGADPQAAVKACWRGPCVNRTLC